VGPTGHLSQLVPAWIIIYRVLLDEEGFEASNCSRSLMANE
jgi:hypothetical protein